METNFAGFSRPCLPPWSPAALLPSAFCPGFSSGLVGQVKGGRVARTLTLQTVGLALGTTVFCLQEPGKELN